MSAGSWEGRDVDRSPYSASSVGQGEILVGTGRSWDVIVAEMHVFPVVPRLGKIALLSMSLLRRGPIRSRH